jgi:peptide/nickel transport system substrate-binding protein
MEKSMKLHDGSDRAGQRRNSRTLVALLSGLALLVTAACSSGTSQDDSQGNSSTAATTASTSGGATQSGAGEGTTGEGETFTIGAPVDFNTLDPAQQDTGAVMNVLMYDWETLVFINSDGSLAPHLATEWTTSDDGMAITLSLRDGVKFHDGTPFDAEAVKFSLERLISGKVPTPTGGAFQTMESFDVIDPHTIRINLKQPDPDLVANLGTGVAAIISPTSANENGNSPTNIVYPVGTGPYKFQEHVKGSSISFVRNGDYWGDAPYYGKLVVRVMPEASAREAALLSGEIDFTVSPPVSDVEALRNNPDITVDNVPSVRQVGILFNYKNDVFANQGLRKAINLAVDKDTITKNLLFGLAKPADSPLPLGMHSYCDAGGYNYDPEQAKALINDAGLAGTKLTIGSPSGRYLQDIQSAEAIAGYLREVGLDVSVESMDWASYISEVTSESNRYDMYLLGRAAPALDPPTMLAPYLKSDWPPNGTNAFFTKEKIEQGFTAAAVETNPESRDEMFCDLQKKIVEDAPRLFLWNQDMIMVYQSDIEGISYQPGEYYWTIGAQPKN